VLGGEVAQGLVALLDVVEAQRQRVPGVTELGAALHRRAGDPPGGAADPDGRVRTLGGTRRERRAREACVLPLVLGHVGGEGRLDRADVVVAQLAALPERQTQVRELRLVPAHADAENETPARGLVDGGRRLGRDEGAAVGEHDHAGAEVDAAGAAGEEGEERERIGPVAAVVLGRGRLGQDVVGHEHAVDPQLLRARRQRLRLGHGELPDR